MFKQSITSKITAIIFLVLIFALWVPLPNWRVLLALFACWLGTVLIKSGKENFFYN